MLLSTLLTDPILYLRIIIIVIISICLHELAHGWMALRQGDDTPERTGHMTFNPVVHMGYESMIFLVLFGISWGQMPVNPSKFRHRRLGNILVSAAGPLLNLGLAFLAICLLKSGLGNSSLPIFSEKFIFLIAYLNLYLFIFNILPIPPLDGFHIASELFPSLKILETGYLGLFAFVILFTAGLSSGISMIVKAIISALI
ncbi:MAG: site-2 protease family protein [Cyanosarcina radialis HA8281-LM2]|jgi:Zn-dependent protease|nr:site-2 protease family protein [Cyanosarcina radialis HA8281-LM2]